MNNPSKVYYTDLRTHSNDNLPKKLQRLIRTAGIGDIDMEKKFVAIKLHFGEPGNLSFLRPNYAKAVADVVKELGGIPFLTDSGCSSYGHPLDRTYYCKDDAHNVLLIGHRGQREEDQVRGSKFPGKLYDSYQGEDFLFVGADATGPYAHLCSRDVSEFPVGR